MAKHSIENVNSNEKKTARIDKTSVNSNKKNPKRRNKNNIGKIIIFIVFLVVFLFSSINLIRWAIYNQKSVNLIENIIEDNFKEKSTDDIDSSISTNPVDFKALKDINSDVVAWIRIKDTSINYPIVQTTDNEYYLHKDINKKYSTCGWIFMDYKNTESFIDKNTVLYGHNLKSGLMFADLTKVLNNKLGNEVTIEIYTPTEKLEYVVFSTYMEEPEDYAIKSNIVDDVTQGAYIKEMLNRSSIKYNIVPDKSDKLLTLSTCDSTGKNRILVHSVYKNGEKY